MEKKPTGRDHARDGAATRDARRARRWQKSKTTPERASRATRAPRDAGETRSAVSRAASTACNGRSGASRSAQRASATNPLDRTKRIHASAQHRRGSWPTAQAAQRREGEREGSGASLRARTRRRLGPHARRPRAGRRRAEGRRGKGRGGRAPAPPPLPPPPRLGRARCRPRSNLPRAFRNSLPLFFAPRLSTFRAPDRSARAREGGRSPGGPRAISGRQPWLAGADRCCSGCATTSSGTCARSWLLAAFLIRPASSTLARACR